MAGYIVFDQPTMDGMQRPALLSIPSVRQIPSVPSGISMPPSSPAGPYSPQLKPPGSPGYSAPGSPTIRKRNRVPLMPSISFKEKVEALRADKHKRNPELKGGLRVATADTSDFSEITAEQKLQAMLGHVVTGKNAEPLFYREDFCGVCGIQHSRPTFLDMYPYCTICSHTLREPTVLRNRYKGVIDPYPLEICSATFGDPFDVTKIIDVTEKCRELTKEYTTRDRLYIRSSQCLAKLFCDGDDILPGKQKQLRVRYRIRGVHGFVNMDTTPTNRFPTGFFLTTPPVRYLTIVSATYGHPKGRAASGRMSYDVTEKVQGLVDLSGGSYLLMSHNTPVARYFGDPCPGYVKELFIMYDIDGRSGSALQDETNGFLRRRISVHQSPVVAPLMFVSAASYGITPSGRRERLLTLGQQMRKIYQIEHKMKAGLVMQVEDVAIMRNKDKIIAERNYFKNTECKFVDVTTKMQRLVDLGRNAFVLDKHKFDANGLFSNPIPAYSPEEFAAAHIAPTSPGHHGHGHHGHGHHGHGHHHRAPHGIANKLLEVQIVCQGHDSEKQTDSREVTLSGHPRNFITGKAARFCIPVRDEKETGRGVLTHSLRFDTSNSHPIIIVTKALYGYLSNLSKVIDVTATVQGMVEGRFLLIDKDLDLDKAFTNPCRGLKKQLKIEYTTRGFSGSLRIREKDDTLTATIELGYPPQVAEDDGADL